MSFLEIARKINRQGDAFLSKYGIKDFHQRAAELLQHSHLHQHFDQLEVSKSVFSGNNHQHFRNLEFSDLPITVSQSKHCFIDIYFWRRRPTVIHNHHFAGAFMCLEGKNVDWEFVFNKERAIGKFHQLGKLELKQKRTLAAGDVAPIAFLDKFIHQNHHQAEVTVNLCFRTPQNPKKNLANYLYSGLRYEKNADLMGRVGRLQKMMAFQIQGLKADLLSHDEAIHFLITSYDQQSQNPLLLKLRKDLHARVKKECGLELDKCLSQHEKKMDELENDYE